MSVHDDLKAYLDGELDAERAQEVKLALERDPILHQEFVQLNSLTHSITAYAVEFESRGLEETLKSLQKARPPKQMPLYRWVWIGGLVTTAVFVWVIAFPLFSQSKMSAKSAFLDSSAKSSDMAGEMKQELASPLQGHEAAKAPSSDAFSSRMVAKAAPKPAAGKTRSDSTFRVAQANPSITYSDSTLMGGARVPTGTINLRSPLKQPSQAHVQRPLSVANLPASPAETVVLTFDTRESGAQKVLAVVGKYQVVDGVDQVAMAKKAKNDEDQSIIVDLPADSADKTIEDLRRLQAKVILSSNAAATTTSSSAGGFGGPAGAPAAPRTAGGGMVGSFGSAAGRAKSGDSEVTRGNRVTNTIAGRNNSATPMATNGRFGGGGRSDVSGNLSNRQNSQVQKLDSAKKVSNSGNANSSVMKQNLSANPADSLSLTNGIKTNRATRRIIIVIKAQQKPKPDPVP